MKVQKSASNYSQAAYDQVQILSKVSLSADEQWSKDLSNYIPGFHSNQTYVVQLLNTFLHSGPNGDHVCMVFQILGVNLLEVIKAYKYKGIPVNLCRSMARQTLIGLDYLNRVCGIIHTDLKPENVLLQLTQNQMAEILTEGRLINKLPEPSQPAETKSLTPPIQDRKLRRIQKKKRYRKRKREQMKKMKNEQSTQASQTAVKPFKRRKRNRKLRTELLNNQASAPKIFNKSTINPVKVEKEEPEQKRMGIDQNVDVKVADLGNGCWVNHHHSDLIQTRQYRSPQVILGITYNQSADIWSFACMLFELLTGDLLFEPKSGNTYGKNDDHLAQMIETLGLPNIDWVLSGRFSKHYFNKYGVLKKIKELKVWLLEDVLIEKYKFKPEQAKKLACFMKPMLEYQPEKRLSAREALKSPWLWEDDNELFMDEFEYLEYIKKVDALKIERIERLERGEDLSSPEVPMPYQDDADNELESRSESWFSDEEERVGFEENEEYHHKMLAYQGLVL